MQEIISFLTSKEVKTQTQKIGKIFENFPHLPKRLMEFFVKITPIFLILAAFGLSVSALQNIFLVGHRGYSYGIFYWNQIPRLYFYLLALVEIITAVVSVLAFQATKERKYEGWLLLFWITVLSVISNILSLIFLGYGILGILLSLAISLYFLFEMEPFYVEKKAVAKKKSSTTKKKTSKKTSTKKTKKK
jgi:hypothetical protein